jgi:hypothetical protein
MDPASMTIIAHALEPFLGLIALAVIPTSLVYVVKHHKVRMRELDLQEKMLLQSGGDTRLTAIEARLAAIEEALGTPARKSLQERAALLEGPATSAADPALRTRDR